MSVTKSLDTIRPVIVQGSTAPVFHGPSDDVLRCASCAHVLVDGYDPRSLIGINIECFKCKGITRTNSWPNGEPLPATLVTLGDDGRFLITGTVDLKDHAAMSCNQEIERVRTGTSPRSPSDADWDLSHNSLMELETELDILTDGAIQKMMGSVKRSHAAGNSTFAQEKSPPVWALDQLHRSLSSDHTNLDGLDGIAFAYVQRLRDSLHRWRHHALFNAIARSLCHEFHHATTTFMIAGYLSDHENAVGFTDTSAQPGKSPDLFINVARNETLSIEVKCPQSFFWPAQRPSKSDMIRRAERVINDARDQITGTAGGVVVIGAGHYSPGFDTEFEQCITEVVGRGRVSTRVAAVSGVAFFSPEIEGRDYTRGRITSGGHVYIVRNPRFQGPNPLETERPLH